MSFFNKYMQGMQKKAKNGNWQPYLFSTSCVGEFKI